MTDVEMLRENFARGELLAPDPDRPNLVDLARALGTLAGAEVGELGPNAAELARRIGPADHLVFILADGLGLNLLEGQPEDRVLCRHRVAELRSIFPSTTAAALTTLATGAWPSQHGVTGQWTHLPRIQGSAALLPFAARSGGRPLGQLGVSADQAFPLPALMGQMSRDVLALFPSLVANGVSSVYFSGSRPRRGYENLAEAAEIILDRVRSAALPTYTYLYTPWIDSETHWLGVRNQGVRSVLGELSRVVERLAEGIVGRGRIVLTADHGLLDAPVTARHAIKPSADLFGVLRFSPSGDDRALICHVAPGAEERFREQFTARYGDRFFLLSIAEAEELALFGPGLIAPLVRERFGDFILISRGADVIEYVATGQVGRRFDLNAYHSGLSPAEMRVPLIVI